MNFFKKKANQGFAIVITNQNYYSKNTILLTSKTLSMDCFSLAFLRYLVKERDQESPTSFIFFRGQ
jgi:hypothetical protein